MVSAAKARFGVIVEIADTGPGIPPLYRENVTERFFRLPDTAHVAGTGLGLSLVSAIVGLHKGRLAIGDAEPGTLVRLEFGCSKYQ